MNSLSWRVEVHYSGMFAVVDNVGDVRYLYADKETASSVANRSITESN